MNRCISIIMCLIFALYSIGCHSMESITLAQKQTISEKNYYEIINKNDTEIEYEKDSVDSIQIGRNDVMVYKGGQCVNRISLDSVESIDKRVFSWTKTIGLSISIPIVLLGVTFMIVLSNVNYGG